MPLNLASPAVAELSFVALAVVVFWAGARTFGRTRAAVFLLGSVLWTAPVENFAVLRGAYTYYGYAGKILPNYPGYLMWVGLVPFWVVLGWFVFAMSGFLIFHGVLLTKRRALLQAAASGIFAVNIDLMMDPVASSNALWVWLTASFKVVGTPLFNLVGWFLLIFFYDLIARHTIMDSKPMPGLSRVEALVFRPRAGPGSGIDSRRLVFRILVLETVVIVLLALLTPFIDYLAFTVF